jgi:hypothetical protein
VQEMEEGQRVKLEDTHHQHNKELKKLEDEKGTVKKQIGHNHKCLVKFDESKTKKLIEQWWIKPKWLKKIEE